MAVMGILPLADAVAELAPFVVNVWAHRGKLLEVHTACKALVLLQAFLVAAWDVPVVHLGEEGHGESAGGHLAHGEKRKNKQTFLHAPRYTGTVETGKEPPARLYLRYRNVENEWGAS